MLFMVYPHMIPTKTPPVPPGNTSHLPQYNQHGLIPKEGPTGVGSVSTAAAASKAERYRPKIFGFQVHEVGKLQRWQEGVRDR